MQYLSVYIWRCLSLERIYAYTLALSCMGSMALSANWSLYVVLQADGMLHRPARRALTVLESALLNNPFMSGCVDLISGSRVLRSYVCKGKLVRSEIEIASLFHVLKTGCEVAFTPGSTDKTCVIFSGHGSGVLTPTWDPRKGHWTYEADAGDSAFARYCHQQEKQFLAPLLPDNEHDSLFFDPPEHKSLFLAADGTQLFSLKQLDELFSWLTVDHLENEIDIIGFDACTMAFLEVGYVLKSYGHFAIASQTYEEKEGWDYREFLTILSNEREPLSVVRRWVYTHESLQKFRGQPRYSLSCFDLAALDELLYSLMNVADTLRDLVPTTKGLIPALMAARARAVPPWQQMPYADLGLLLEALFDEIGGLCETPELANLKMRIVRCLELLHVMTVASMASPAARLTGCSLYFPHAIIDRSYSPGEVLHRWEQFLQVFVTLPHQW